MKFLVTEVSGSKVEKAKWCYGPDHAREYALLTVTSDMAVINCYSYYMQMSDNATMSNRPPWFAINSAVTHNDLHYAAVVVLTHQGAKNRKLLPYVNMKVRQILAAVHSSGSLTHFEPTWEVDWIAVDRRGGKSDWWMEPAELGKPGYRGTHQSKWLYMWG
jgi:hypothetical protein